MIPKSKRNEGVDNTGIRNAPPKTAPVTVPILSLPFTTPARPNPIPCGVQRGTFERAKYSWKMSFNLRLPSSLRPLVITSWTFLSVKPRNPPVNSVPPYPFVPQIDLSLYSFFHGQPPLRIPSSENAADAAVLVHAHNPRVFTPQAHHPRSLCSTSRARCGTPPRVEHWRPSYSNIYSRNITRIPREAHVVEAHPRIICRAEITFPSCQPL